MNRPVHICYGCFDHPWPERLWEAHLSILPLPLRARICRYRRWQDRQLACLGKILLCQGLRFYGYPPETLERLQYTETGRPFLDGTIDFNISHSGEYAVCAVVEGARVGIDIEKKFEVSSLTDLLFCMSREEQERILASSTPADTFLKYWVAKESLVKLLGYGIGSGISQILVDKEGGHFHDGIFVRDIFISAGYQGAIATDFRTVDIVLHRWTELECL